MDDKVEALFLKIGNNLNDDQKENLNGYFFEQIQVNRSKFENESGETAVFTKFLEDIEQFLSDSPSFTVHGFKNKIGQLIEHMK